MQNDIFHPLCVVCGIALFAGITHLIIGVRKGNDKVHLYFGSLSLSIGTGVVVILLQNEGLILTLIRFLSYFLADVFLVLFASYYSGLRKRRLIIGLLSLTFSSFILRIGLVINYGITAPMEVVSFSRITLVFTYSSMVLIMGYVLCLSFLQYKKHGTRDAVVLGIAGSILLMSVVTEFLADSGYIDFFYSTYYYFVGIIILMSIQLSNQIVNTENKLKESEERYRAIVEASPDAVSTTDLEGNLNYLSKQTLNMHGFSEDELLGKNSLTLIAPEDHERAMGVARDTLTNGVTKGVEYKFVRKDGSIFLAELGASVIRGRDGKPTGFIAITRDITDRKQAEVALKESEERYRKIFETIPDGIFVSGFDAKFVEVNPAASEIYGYTKEEFLELDARDLVAKEDHEKCFSFFEELKSKGYARVSTHDLRKDGSSLVVDVQGTVILHNGREHALTIVSDVSTKRQAEEDKKNLEKQLFQAQKMESIGRLAGGIAHDFNNILTSIMGYAELLKLKFIDVTTVEGEAADIILTGAEKASDLTKQLLGFARGGKYNPVPLSINDSIKNAVRVSEKIFEKKIAVEYSIDDEVSLIDADKNQIDQVLTNLIINAKDAMPFGGKLNFETKNVLINNESLSIDSEIINGKFVKISVTDTGIGMTREISEHIFEPFFSTKGEGKGTGLGLATVYGIIRNHNGFINVYSEPNIGTTFNIYFPVSTGKAVESKVSEELIKGDAKILLIDDEENVRNVAEKMLKHLGYSVKIFENGLDAISYYEDEKNNIDLVILDIIMPNIDGRSTFLELKKINKNVKVLIASGYSQSGHAKEIVELGAAGFVQKPFRVHELSRVINGILN